MSKVVPQFDDTVKKVVTRVGCAAEVEFEMVR